MRQKLPVNTGIHETEALSPFMALAPIVFLIAMPGCSVYLFGADSSYGANQIALVLATLTSTLILWNTCGTYMSATLGVATLTYAPYAIFNLLCPVIAIIYGFLYVALKPAAFDLEGDINPQEAAA